MDYIEKFKSYVSRQKTISKATIKNYIKDVAHFITWCEDISGSTFAPHAVEQKHIVGYINALTVSSVSKQRYLSSLRKFFHFLQAEGVIQHDPCEKARTQQRNDGLWQLDEFADYLHHTNISALTIKYYLMDIKHFLRWLEAEKQQATKDLSLVGAYMQQLAQYHHYTQATLHRKQAAIRKYMSWRF